MCLLSTVQLLILFNSTEHNSFPSLYPSLLSLKEPSITTIWGKNISFGEIWSIASLCTVFKIRWLLVWWNFIFLVEFFLSCQLHHHQNEHQHDECRAANILPRFVMQFVKYFESGGRDGGEMYSRILQPGLRRYSWLYLFHDLCIHTSTFSLSINPTLFFSFA